MPGISSWMAYAPQAVKGFDDDELSIYSAYVRQVTKLCGHNSVKVTTRTNNSL